MKRIKKYIFWNKLSGLLTFILVISLIVAVCFLAVELKKQKTDNALGYEEFSVGVCSLNNDSTVLDFDSSIKTSIFAKYDYIPEKSEEILSVRRVKDSNVSYRLFFLDKDEKLVCSTNELTKDFDLKEFIEENIVQVPVEDKNYEPDENGEIIVPDIIEEKFECSFDARRINSFVIMITPIINDGADAIVFNNVEQVREYANQVEISYYK